MTAKLKVLNVFLLILIIIGTYLLFTQDKWVNPLVNYILSLEGEKVTVIDSKWSNKVTAVRTDCAYDGICSVTVGDVEVIISSGGRRIPPEEMGQVIGDFARNPMEDYVGKKASVYARKLGPKLHTLEGDSEFYIDISI